MYRPPKAEAIWHLAQQIATQFIPSYTPFTASDLYPHATRAFGGSMAEGAYDRRDVWDAVELGVNRHLLAQKGIRPVAEWTRLHTINIGLGELSARLPTHTVRTEEQLAYQQFSTPPTIAHLMAWAAQIRTGDVVLEPSAGLGGIALFASKVAGVAVYVNELHDQRRELLNQLHLWTSVTAHDAGLIHALFDRALPPPTVVLMNPPFSHNVAGNRPDPLLAATHIASALHLLAPKGRLVALVSGGRGGDEYGGMHFQAPRYRDWWREMLDGYRVRANIGLDGRLYHKYGTTIRTRILVIDKAGPTYTEPLTAELTRTQDGFEALKAMPGREARRTERLVTAAPAALVDRLLGTPQFHPVATVAPPNAASVPDSPPVGISAGSISLMEMIAEIRQAEAAAPSVPHPPRANRSGRRHTRPAPAAVRPPTDGTHAVAPVPHGAIDGLENPQGAEGRPESPPPVAPVPPASSSPESRAGSDVDQIIQQLDTEVDAGRVFEPWQPYLRIRGAQPHDAPLVESDALRAVQPPVPTTPLKVARWVVEQGRASDAQLEAAALAVHAQSQRLTNGARRGYLGGEGTGFGKGALAAVVARHWWLSEERRILWVTAEMSLAHDATRDWTWVGGDAADVFTQAGEKKRIQREAGILVTTYSTLSMEARQAGVSGTVGIDRLTQILDWQPQIVIFDEAHAMTNLTSVKGKRGRSKPSKQALRGKELLDKLPDARVLFLSATAATEVRHLEYAAERLGLCGAGVPAFPTTQDFITKISEGGLLAMELVARDMKQMGIMSARSLSLEGTTNDLLVHTLTPEQRDMYRAACDAWRTVLKGFYKALVTNNAHKNSDAKRHIGSQLWGTAQRFFEQFLISLQMPTALAHMRERLAAGEAIVVQIVNTYEAATRRAVADALANGIALEEMDITPRDTLMQLVRSSFPVIQYRPYRDADGNEHSEMVTDGDGNPVENPVAVEQREALLFEIANLRVSKGPLDQLIDAFGHEQIAEVTGRSERFVAATDEHGQPTILRQPRSKAKADAEVQAFLDDQLQILVFSGAGNTGRSYHSDRLCRNQRRRNHYVLQAGWIASEAMQSLGRTHRTRQVNAPHYVLVTTDLAGQRRFMTSISRRLQQLGSLTRGNRHAAGAGLFKAEDNLETPWAKMAVEAFFLRLFRGSYAEMSLRQVADEMGLPDLVSDTGTLNEEAIPPVTKFLNRLLILPPDRQDEVYAAFEREHALQLDAARQQGLLDLGVEKLLADRITVVAREVVNRHPDSGAVTEIVELEVAKALPRPHFDEFLHSLRPHAASDRQWVQNKRSGRVYLTLPAPSALDTKSGRLTEMVYRHGIEERERLPLHLVRSLYTPLTANEAEVAWAEMLATLPTERVDTVFLIVGAVLPVWDRLGRSKARILVAETDHGERLIGRLVEQREVHHVFTNLGLVREGVYLTPEEQIAAVLDEGAVLTLANGWKLTRRWVAGEYRLAIDGISWSEAKSVRDEGVLHEYIANRPVYYLPTGTEAFARITRLRPVVKLNRAGSEVAVLAAPPERQAVTAPTAAPENVDISRLIQFVEEAAPRTPTSDVVRHVPSRAIPVTQGGFALSDEEPTGEGRDDATSVPLVATSEPPPIAPPVLLPASPTVPPPRRPVQRLDRLGPSLFDLLEEERRIA